MRSECCNVNNMEKLSGGNLTNVYRQNETVLREQKACSETIHRLLLHLEKRGCNNVPRFMGIADTGMEIVSFVQGECKEDYPFTNDIKKHLLIIKKVAEMMRRYHDATLTFEKTEKDNWMLSYKGDLEKEVICHNDIAPYNVTFVDGMPYGIIDFDTCCPGPRIWDIVYALYRFVPFSESIYDIEKLAYRHYDKDKDRDFRRDSIRVFFDAYGMECPNYLFEQMRARLQALADLINYEAKNGNSNFQKMLKEGHRDMYLREIEFINKHAEEWMSQ